MHPDFLPFLRDLLNTVLVPFFLTALATTLGPALLAVLALVRWRRLPSEPWMERARRLHPVRQAHAAWLFILPCAALVARLHFFREASLPAVLVGAVLGTTLSGWPLERAAFPSLGLNTWFRSAIIVSVLRLGWILLVVVFASCMPSSWAFAQLGWALGFLAVSGALSAGLIHHVLHALGMFRSAGPRLSALVAECSAETGVAVKSVWEFSSPVAYAAALVTQRTLIFSTTLSADLDDEELRAICRHELAHLNEGPALIFLRVTQMPLSLLPFVFTSALVVSFGPFALLAPILSWLLLLRFFRRLSLRLEKRADDAARQGAGSPAFARALERINRRNLVPSVLSAKASRTHPDLYDRMIAAGVTPDYPRPLPPPDHHWLQLLGIALNIKTVLGWLVLQR
jgi:Zn-dependent protease with chaperone function